MNPTASTDPKSLTESRGQFVPDSLEEQHTIKTIARTKSEDQAQDSQLRPVKHKLSLLIPMRNEERAIEATIRAAKNVFSEHEIEAEILVIDDGSQDRSAEIARAHGARVVSHLYGRGYGYALRTGVLAAKYDTLVISDADGTYPLEKIPMLLETYERGYDLVIGARTGRHFRGSLTKGVARRLFHFMCETAAGVHVPDANSGLRVFRRSALLPYLPMMCTTFSFTTSQTLCFLLLSRPVVFVPIEYHERVGRTKVKHFRDSIRTMQYIMQMFAIFNPVKLFTLLSFLPTAIAILALVAQTGLSVLGLGGSWGTALLLSLVSLGIAGMLFGTGFIIYGVTRQRWPDMVSGAGNAALGEQGQTCQHPRE